MRVREVNVGEEERRMAGSRKERETREKVEKGERWGINERWRKRTLKRMRKRKRRGRRKIGIRVTREKERPLKSEKNIKRARENMKH